MHKYYCEYTRLQKLHGRKERTAANVDAKMNCILDAKTGSCTLDGSEMAFALVVHDVSHVSKGRQGREGDERGREEKRERGKEGVRVCVDEHQPQEKCLRHFELLTF
jgi:hypothetical protein